jgi:outer membrane receptor for ferrienterochelin and colicin
MKSIYLLSLLFGLFFCTHFVQAQKGTLKGKVKDAANSEDIIGANVSIEGTGLGAATDIDGSFTISNIPAGTYNVLISIISYKTKKYEGVKIEAGKITNLEVAIEEDAEALGEVVVVGERETFTDVSVINEIKLSQQVISGISSEQISKNQDKDAAQAMSRIPGVTINDGRFVIIRGVSDRYNNVMINDAIAPSTEIDVRSFSFDLLPSSMLDRMLLFKSGSAENPGDFAGGVIKLYTQNVVTENSFSVSIGTGYRAGTTFRNRQLTKGSSTDFLGFDDGKRSVPSNFPNNLVDVRPLQRVELSKELQNNYQIQEDNFAPDLKLGIKFTRKMLLAGKLLTNVSIINYSNTAQQTEIIRNRYDQFNSADGFSPKQIDYTDQSYAQNVRLGLMHNWMFRLNSRNRIEFKNSFNQLAENETVIRRGANFTRNNYDEMRNYGLQYTSRSIYSGQIAGKHEFLGEKLVFNWVVALNYVHRTQPDLGRFRSVRDTRDPESQFRFIEPATTSSLFDMSRFHSILNETNYGTGGNLELKLGQKPTEKSITVKTGYYVDYRDRKFTARYFTYLPAPNPNNDDIIRQNVDRIFNSSINDLLSPNNLGLDGLVMSEIRAPKNTYFGQNFLFAGYLTTTIPITDKLTVSTGVRLEHNLQKFSTYNDSDIDRLEEVVNNPITNLLPSLNIGYDISKKMLVRTSYARTVNRPEFRELAPFLFYDFNLDANLVGDNKLKTAVIDNFDLRWEVYPTAGDVISVGFFYKYFENPIESKVGIAGFGQQFSYVNAKKAENIGVEVEAKKALEFVSPLSRFFKNTSLVVNGALIRSTVDFGDDVALAQDRKRPLQGQSPYTVNTGIYYNDTQIGLSVNTLYNVFGPRIFTVGSDVYPTIYELPRHVIDLNISKTLGKQLELRLSISDILNAPYRFKQDSNRDTEITSVDESVINFRRGTYFTLGLSFKM